jgi:hypothetical protein
MKYLLTFIIFPLFLNSFKTGEGTAKLTCKSQSGRTLFEAEFGEYTILRQAKLTIDKDNMPFYYSDRCTVIFDPEAKVYTLNIESEAHGNFDTARFVQLWAIPSTFTEESSSGTEFHDVYKFTGKLQARDPRKGKEYKTPLILLNCTLTYTNP